jgi:hypothetical protein
MQPKRAVEAAALLHKLGFCKGHVLVALVADPLSIGSYWLA